MIMMGPKKDKGGLMVAIMEKLKGGKGSYEEGKEHNEKMMEEVDHGYKSEVDGMFEAIKSENKEEFGKHLKEFIKKCVKEDYKKEDHKEEEH